MWSYNEPRDDYDDEQPSINWDEVYDDDQLEEEERHKNILE